MLTPKIGNRVNFGPPRDRLGGPPRTGMIVDEVWDYGLDHHNGIETHRRAEHPPTCWGDYAFCSQLIRWDTGGHTIRLAYYRRRCGEAHWEFASQTTVEAFPQTIKTLLEQTLKKSAWFDVA